MKYPNPTFLDTAENLKKTRRKRTLIIIVCLVVVVLVFLFVLKMASLQEQYRKDYPELVGAATATYTSYERVITSRTTAPTETEATTTESETTVLLPTIITTTIEEETEPTEETEQNNAPDIFDEAEENTYFLNYHPYQVITHDLRDQYLDDLKLAVSGYINDYPGDARICFSYRNLKSNETMGINDLEPIVPAGSFALPLEIAFYEKVYDNSIYLYDIATFQNTIGPSSGYIVSNYDVGKQFYLRALANYAIVHSDTVALNLLLAKAGGLDSLIPIVNGISGYIDFTGEVVYQDYQGNSLRGTGRTCAYDMTLYAEYLYNGYINNPEEYQYLINDLAASEVETPLSTVFEGDLILHVSGRNDDVGAYTDVAIIDGDEPIVLCIYVECESYERAQLIENDIATFTESFISSCH